MPAMIFSGTSRWEEFGSWLRKEKRKGASVNAIGCWKDPNGSEQLYVELGGKEASREDLQRSHELQVFQNLIQSGRIRLDQLKN